MNISVTLAVFKPNYIFAEKEKVFHLMDSTGYNIPQEENPVLDAWI